MRAVSLLLLLAATGCMSSSPRTAVTSPEATTLLLDYDSRSERIVDTLESRGCAAQTGFAFECPLQGDGGRSYTVAISALNTYPYDYLPAPSASPAPTNTEAREVAAEGGFRTDDGYVGGLQLQPPEHALPGGSARGARPDSKLEMAVRVLDRATGEPVRLAGDAAAALRESLRALLVQDLPVIRASYE